MADERRAVGLKAHSELQYRRLQPHRTSARNRRRTCLGCRVGTPPAHPARPDDRPRRRGFHLGRPACRWRGIHHSCDLPLRRLRVSDPADAPRRPADNAQLHDGREGPVPAMTERADPSEFELYKLAVEMADRVAARRAVANTFFLTVNTALAALLGAADLGWAVGAAGLVFALTWWWLLQSYRNLSSAKFRVINSMEPRLPVQLFSEEW